VEQRERRTREGSISPIKGAPKGSELAREKKRTRDKGVADLGGEKKGWPRKHLEQEGKGERCGGKGALKRNRQGGELDVFLRPQKSRKREKLRCLQGAENKKKEDGERGFAGGKQSLYRKKIVGGRKRRPGGVSGGGIRCLVSASFLETPSGGERGVRKKKVRRVEEQ